MGAVKSSDLPFKSSEVRAKSSDLLSKSSDLGGALHRCLQIVVPALLCSRIRNPARLASRIQPGVRKDPLILSNLIEHLRVPGDLPGGGTLWQPFLGGNDRPKCSVKRQFGGQRMVIQGWDLGSRLWQR